MKRFLSILLLIAMLCAWCAGCDEPVEEVVQLPEGYISAGSMISGGQEIGDVNAKALHIETVPSGDATETRLAFEFVSGSRISGGTEETTGIGVPSYSVYTLDHPSRLVVEFPLLAHWDYTHGLTIRDELVAASFQQSIVGDPTMRVYFQLNQPVILSAKEDGDRLTISLRPQEQEATERHFVTVNAYQAYGTGAFSGDVNLSPTLSSDGSNILLISPAFETEEQAQAFLTNGRGRNPDIPQEQWQVVTLADGTLPEYKLELAHISAYQALSARYEDTPQTLPVLVPNGLYLCDMPEGGFLFSRELDLGDGEEVEYYQQLWAMQPDGQMRLLTGFEFSAIENAQFSPDGRKLAILERAQAKTHLYVFDTDTYELLNDLSEMGFGGNTSAFTWNALGNIVYAITGTSGMQLHQFDYSIPDETQRHSIVDRNSVDEGGLGLFDGELYFCTSDMEEGAWLYRIKPEGGVRKPFVAGSSFVFSQDNRYIAILISSETSANLAEQQLILQELATGEERLITSDFFPYDVIWSRDCKTLYYIESRITGGQSEDATSGDVDVLAESDDTESEDADSVLTEGLLSTPAPAAQPDPFPYTLWAYDVEDGTSRTVVDLIAPDLFAAEENDVLYLNRFEADETGTQMRACYRLDLSALGQPVEEEAPEATPAP